MKKTFSRKKKLNKKQFSRKNSEFFFVVFSRFVNNANKIMAQVLYIWPIPFSAAAFCIKTIEECALDTNAGKQLF
jgi:hypothetical protein